MRCINCHLTLTRLQRHRLSDEAAQIFEKVQRWVHPRDITGDDFICHSCWELISSNSENETRQRLGHRKVCVACGRSVLRIWSMQVLKTDMSERETQVGTIISGWMRPRLLTPNDEVCKPCYMRAQRKIDSARRSSPNAVSTTSTEATSHPVTFVKTEQIVDIESAHRSSADFAHSSSSEEIQSVPSAPISQDVNVEEVYLAERSPNTQQIVLPTLRRAAETARRCLFLECNHSEKQCVPDILRRHIIKDFNFYIPIKARICNFHLSTNSFHELYAAENAITTFSAAQIEEIVYLLAYDNKFDFQYPETIDDHLFKYWFGQTKSEFNEILVEMPRLNNCKIKCGLCALLCKKWTGHSDERISALFQIPRRTLGGYAKKAQEILQDYVSGHQSWVHEIKEELLSEIYN